MERAEAREHALQDGARLVQVERPGPGDPLAERLAVDRRVGDVGAAAHHPGLDLGREVLVRNLRREADPREVAGAGSCIPRGLVPEDLERPRRAVPGREVDDPARPVAELLGDREGTELVAGLQLLDAPEAFLPEVLDPRIHLGARRDHGVDERLDGVELEAPIRERAGERRLRRRAADLARGESEQVG